MGLFSYQEYSGGQGTKATCVQYSREQLDGFFDAPMVAARAFAASANLFLVAGSLALTIGSCASFEPFLLKILGGVLILGSVFEALMFIVLESVITEVPHSGSLWWGGIVNAFGSLFAMAAGMITCRLGKADPSRRPTAPSHDCERGLEQARPSSQNRQSPKRQRMPPGAETVTEELLPDGSHKIVTTMWNKDGTTTVTEEVK